MAEFLVNTFLLHFIKMGSSKLLAAIFLSLTASVCAIPELLLADCKVAAQTEQGFVCGKLRKSTNGQNYASFRGIPYAKQPVGILRFKELQPAEPFDGVFNAQEDGPVCAQANFDLAPLDEPFPITEDCIRLNIHIPEKFLPDLTAPNKTKCLQPVLFWVHGGSCSFGSGNSAVFGPEYLMTKDIIVVTINYRLNVFGFLSLDNEYIPGNNGLRDVITALKWVQRNIKNFGGDPDRVTLTGQSSGGVIVHLLSISPATKGLFNQVVALSGNSISGFYSYSKVYRDFLNALFFSAVGIDPLQSPEKVYEDLLAVPLKKILDVNNFLLNTLGIVSFGPVIETPQLNFTTVIPKDPQELLNEGAGKEYPMIIGFCNNEAAAFKTRLEKLHYESRLLLMPELIVPPNLLYSTNRSTVQVLKSKQLKEYYNLTSITLDKFVVAATDSYFKYPAQRLAQKRVAAGAARTYMYQFGYPGENLAIRLGIGRGLYPGAGHSEDITYFFRINILMGSQTTPNELAHTNADSQMRDYMTTFIANYVKNGSPVEDDKLWPPSQCDLKFQNIEWPYAFNFTEPTPYMEEKIDYYTKLYKIANYT